MTFNIRFWERWRQERDFSIIYQNYYRCKIIIKIMNVEYPPACMTAGSVLNHSSRVEYDKSILTSLDQNGGTLNWTCLVANRMLWRHIHHFRRRSSIWNSLIRREQSQSSLARYDETVLFSANFPEHRVRSIRPLGVRMAHIKTDARNKLHWLIE